MGAPVGLAFDVGKSGWSKVALTIGSASISIDDVSYTTDALGDLVRGALILATGGGQAVIQFDHEPSETRMVATRNWTSGIPGDLLVRILTFDDLYADRPDAEGGEIFSGPCDVDDFARAVLDAAESVGREYGEEGYHAAWTGFAPFPVRGIAALRVALSTVEGATPRMEITEDTRLFIRTRED